MVIASQIFSRTKWILTFKLNIQYGTHIEQVCPYDALSGPLTFLLRQGVMAPILNLLSRNVLLKLLKDCAMNCFLIECNCDPCIRR